jgi:type II secretory pathway pseudopilin PulG
MEFAIVMSIVALLLTLLLQRLGETAGDARRVQLRMAVEALRINAALLQLRCNAEMLEPACWQRALAQRRLRSVALAAGLGEHAGTDGGWTWSSPAPDRLQLEPQGVAHCRLELRWQPQSAAIEVFAVEDRC